MSRRIRVYVILIIVVLALLGVLASCAVLRWQTSQDAWRTLEATPAAAAFPDAIG
ncbi:MAG: hypothetical protein H7Y11_03280 [Armatimonadetes bacterium]|nr:hypothetical protein [Anaerolineae bacterium]